MQSGTSHFASEATRAGATAPYFVPVAEGGLPPGNVDIQGNLGVTGFAVIDGALTVGDTASFINLAGPGNLIGSGPANIAIASDAVISLTPGVGEAVVVDGDLSCTGIVTSRLADGSATSLVASGMATIPGGTTLSTVAFPGMRATGRALATITGNFNGAGALSVVPDFDNLLIFSQNAVSAPTTVFWLILRLS